MDIGIVSIIRSMWAVIVYLGQSIYYLIPKTWNIICRPKLEVILKQMIIVFTSSDGLQHHLDYPCLQIFNRTKKALNIQLRYIQLNKASYQSFVGTDNNYLRLNPNSEFPWVNCNNRIYNEFKNNWLEISQNGFSISLEPQSELIFPLKLIGGNIRTLFYESDSSKLFFSKSKINISFKLNGKIYEYGSNRKQAYELYLNHLASRPHVDQDD